jgi:hypothetical protein
VRSVRDTLAVGLCLCALGAGAAGCSSTQEKAAAKQVEAEHILKARAERQAAKKRHHAEHKGKKHGPTGN